jgi:hypothetical protein
MTLPPPPAEASISLDSAAKRCCPSYSLTFAEAEPMNTRLLSASSARIMNLHFKALAHEKATLFQWQWMKALLACNHVWKCLNHALYLLLVDVMSIYVVRAFWRAPFVACSLTTERKALGCEARASRKTFNVGRAASKYPATEIAGSSGGHPARSSKGITRREATQL